MLFSLLNSTGEAWKFSRKSIISSYKIPINMPSEEMNLTASPFAGEVLLALELVAWNGTAARFGAMESDIRSSSSSSSSSSREQQPRAAAESSSREQRQRAAAENSSRELGEQQQQQRQRQQQQQQQQQQQRAAAAECT